MNPKFVPIVGDGTYYRNNIALKRVSYYHLIEYSMKSKKSDLWFSIFGGTIIFDLLSSKAIEEFKTKWPEFIDRMDIRDIGFGKLISKSFLASRSDKSWKTRRDFYLKEIGLNSASKFIPCMVEQIMAKTKQWKKGVSYNLISEIVDATFNIICIILFGKAIIEEIPKIRYADPANGEIMYLDFKEFFNRLNQDFVIRFRLNLKGFMCLILRKYNLTRPFNLMNQNSKELKIVLRNYVKVIDQNFFLSKAMNAEIGDKDQIIEELCALLLAGYDTTSHFVSSALFLLAKNNDCGNKLAIELQNIKGKSYDELLYLFKDNKIQEYQYLHYVLKETTRIDNLADKSIPYSVVKDTTICGVPLKKNTMINLSLITVKPFVQSPPLSSPSLMKLEKSRSSTKFDINLNNFFYLNNY